MLIKAKLEFSLPLSEEEQNIANSTTLPEVDPLIRNQY